MQIAIRNFRGRRGVYCVIHKTSLMCYVGSAVNIGARLSNHRTLLRKGSTTLFHRALAEFGFDAFDFEILEECPKSNLLEREQFYIALLDSCSLNGFNSQKQVRATYGSAKTEVTRQRISFAKRGSKTSDETKRNMSISHKLRVARPGYLHPQKGKKQSPEWIAKISKAMTGKKLSKQHRQHIREGHLRRKINLQSKTQCHIN